MILDKPFPPDPRVENEALALIANGFEVFLFCLNYNNSKAEEEINGIQVKRFTSNTLEYKLSALAYTIPFYTNLMCNKVAKFLNKFQIDAIHIHDIRIAAAVFKANKKKNLPIVLDLHDNLPEVLKYYPHLQKFPGKQIISLKRWKIKEEEFIHKSNRVISVSPEFLKEIIDRTGVDASKTVLVPNSVRRSFYQDVEIDPSILEKFNDKFTVLYLGDTALRRGLLTAIEALNHLKKTIKNIQLVIVGSNTTDVVLQQKVTDLNLENFVSFEGWQDVHKFPSYILASEVCISPLLRNKQHDVAYANKIFQYMSFAKPILVSNAKAQKKIVEDHNCGLVHQANNVDDFTKQILRLYRDKNLRNILGKNGKLFIDNKFCWEVVSQGLVNLYKELEQENKYVN